MMPGILSDYICGEIPLIHSRSTLMQGAFASAPFSPKYTNLVLYSAQGCHTWYDYINQPLPLLDLNLCIPLLFIFRIIIFIFQYNFHVRQSTYCFTAWRGRILLADRYLPGLLGARVYTKNLCCFHHNREIKPRVVQR
jgi:hypothetical protein